MRLRLLAFLMCPACNDDLTLDATTVDGEDIVTGSLGCPSCSRRFPIIRGIPRFLDDCVDDSALRAVYADSFGHQWTTYDWPRQDDESEFFAITDLSAADLRGRIVLDAGCGGGRFLRFVAEHCDEIIGIDYSIAVERARALTAGRSNVHLIQCDINWHPLKPSRFDIVYSHGVLHHTPDTRRAFDRLPALVRPGGLLYVALFRHTVAPLQWADAFWRGVLNKLPVRGLDFACALLSGLAYVPMARVLKRFFWFSLQPTHQLRKCCLYDWYGPRFHHEHTVAEVMGWFRQAGFAEPQYINAWPYCPADEKYRVPDWSDSFRLGQLLGVRGTRVPRAAALPTTTEARVTRLVA